MSLTKLLVNKMPVVTEDCPFQHGIIYCSIDDGICNLHYKNRACPYLMSYYEFENYGNGIQRPEEKEEP